MPVSIASLGTPSPAAPRIETPDDAAEAFEAMLLKKMMKPLAESIGKAGLFGGGFESDFYGDMFVSAIAENAAGAGLGLSEMIRDSLGIGDRQGSSPLESVANTLRGLDAYRAHTTGKAEAPGNGFLAGIASKWLGSGAAQRWSKDGVLTYDDLGADIVSEGKGGPAVFNVQDASGYEGHPKCNLFAFEMLRRAGYAVPVRAREHGWGYPGADAVARWSEAGSVDNWATVRTQQSKEQLDTLAKAGVPLMIASSAEGDRAGHMAVVDRIHNIERNEEGKILSVEYSGWEAGTKKASYGRRVWRHESVSGGGRGGLD